MDTELRDYYNRRAETYERVYDKPERQSDLARLRSDLKELFRGKRVLEVACGTGYWTQVIAESAESVVASDQSEETLSIARAKPWPRNNVRFVKDDAYKLSASLPNDERGFNAAFAGFWWSHVPHLKIQEFLNALHGRLKPGALVVFLDNQYVEGSNHPIAFTDQVGDTYQRRALPDGTEHDVLKNFPTDQELQRHLSFSTDAVDVIRYEYFWLARYRLSTGS